VARELLRNSNMHKVHIVLPKFVVREQGALQELMQRLQAEYSLQNVNLQRVRRFGIATGYMPADQIEPLRGSRLVESVQDDHVRSVL
jgi:hypothetical protein